MNLRDIIDSPRLLPSAALAMQQPLGATEELPEGYWAALTTIKAQAVVNEDQETAKAVWVLETIGRAQDAFIRAFALLSAERFKEAWDTFDRAEIQIDSLVRHFGDDLDEFGIEHISKYVPQFLSLFPYKWGVSPAFVKEVVTCSICSERITLRSDCGHVVGEIYNGEMCVRLVEKAELLHVALVECPSQRYSVFEIEEDHPGFEPVRFLAHALRTPWDRWSVKKEERRTHHPLFKDLEPSDMCECASGKSYAECCMNSETVFPHFDFTFEHEPPPDIPRFTVRRARRR